MYWLFLGVCPIFSIDERSSANKQFPPEPPIKIVVSGICYVGRKTFLSHNA